MIFISLLFTMASLHAQDLRNLDSKPELKELFDARVSSLLAHVLDEKTDQLQAQQEVNRLAKLVRQWKRDELAQCLEEKPAQKILEMKSYSWEEIANQLRSSPVTKDSVVANMASMFANQSSSFWGYFDIEPTYFFSNKFTCNLPKDITPHHPSQSINLQSGSIIMWRYDESYLFLGYDKNGNAVLIDCGGDGWWSFKYVNDLWYGGSEWKVDSLSFSVKHENGRIINNKSITLPLPTKKKRTH